MAAQRVFYFLVWNLCFVIPVVRLQGYFGWTSSDGGHCWSNAGVTCSLQPSGCGPNQVNNPWGVGCKPEANITLNQPTNQSSTVNGQPSNLGVDGDDSTCASTTMMTNRTWYVDLPGLHVVHGVRFKGGVYTSNTCSNRNITIKVESVLNSTTPATNHSTCTQLSGAAHCNSMQPINCGSVQKPANRLVIHHTGTGQLKVCELEIIGYQYPYNLAYGKPVMQDGTHDHRHANLAVDGNLATKLTSQVCTQTGLNKANPWWWVDLGSQNVVYSVRLLNLDSEGNYDKRLRDFTIYVGDKNKAAEFSSNAVCHTHGSTPVGAAASVEFTCQNGPLLGRYVIVQLNWQSHVQLCEVMVKGYKEKACPQRYGPDCSRQCNCPDSQVYTCDYITGTCCGQYKKGNRCEQDLPKLTNAPTKESRTNTSIKVKWDAWNTHTGSGSATGVKYEVEYKPSTGGSVTAIGTQQDTETNVTGLPKDTEYCFSVVVLDENDWRGERSPQSCFKTCSDPTNVNLGVTANLDQVSKTKSNLVITWVSPDYKCDSGRFELRVQQGLISCDQISGTPLNTGSASSFTVQNKIPYTNYTVKITAINNIGSNTDMCKTIPTPEGVPPSPPKPTISSSSNKSLSVAWRKPDPTHGIIVKYNMEYSKTSGGSTSNIRTVNQSTGMNEIATEIHLPDLIPYTNYSIKVRAFTRVGPGRWSETVYAVTDEGIPPSPAISTVTSSSHTTISVKWKKPNPPHGIITKYEIRYSKTSGGATANIISVNQNIGMNEITREIPYLIPYTNYSIQVRAFTSVGPGSWSETLYGVTDEWFPPSPVNATISSRSSTTISVTWGKPDPPHGIITKYEIQYSNTSGGEIPNDRTVNQTIGNDEITSDIPDLIPNTNYSVKVRAYTSVGPGNWSDTLYAITAVGIPEEPEDLRNTSRGQTFIVLEWNPPRVKSGKIEEYKVACGSHNKKVSGDETRETVLNVTGLKTSTLHTCNVKASTSAGFGKESNHINVWTKPKIEVQTATPARKRILSKTGTSITLELVAFPDVDLYRIIVERIAGNRRKKRAVDGNTFPESKLAKLRGYNDAQKNQLAYYITAEMNKSFDKFTVGDGKEYGGYLNKELVTGKTYNVYYGGKKTLDGESDEAYILIVKDEVAESVSEPNNMGAVIGGVLGGLALCLFIVIIVIMLRRKRLGPFNKKADTDNTNKKSRGVNQELMLTDLLQSNPNMEGNSQETRPPHSKNVKENLYTNEPSTEESLYGNIDNGASDVYVENMWEAMQKKTKDVLKLEYEDLPKEFIANCDAGRQKENVNKNRYKNILPYDQTRVVLKPDDDNTSDYINADFMDAYKKSDAFIAAQGPKDVTLIDFWRMIWQYNCPIIVMLTKLVEDGKSKCFKYWPSKGKETHGSITVTLVETEEFASFTVRTFSASKTDWKAKKTIKQFHFTAWPDHGVPKYATALLEFQRKVRHYQDSLTGNGKVVVHCSAGIGRTGAYIALDFLLAQARSEGKFNVFSQIYSMRTQRAKMIQTLEQYYFVHDALLEALLCGDVIYPCSSFQETYPQLKKKQKKANKSKIEEQFDVLRLICPTLDKDSCRTAIEPENISKNRIKNIIPANSSRPYLMTPVDGRSDYINAVFIDGFKKKDAYIITQMPLTDTVVDFWRLMYDHNSHTIVMLNDLDDESCAVYWPSKGMQQHGPLTVEMKKARKIDESIIVRILQLTNTEKPNSKPRDVHLFQFKDWQSNANVPNSKEEFLKLIDEVNHWQKQCDDQTITIHCMNGAQRSGLFCAVSVMLEKMKTEQDVDVFQTVKSIRVNRPQLIEDAGQLEFCYDMAKHYLEGFDTYANFV